MSLFEISPQELRIQEGKTARRQKAERSLEGRRGKVSFDPEVRGIMKDVRAVLADMKYEHPDVVGLGLFGSLVKGYALPTSDVDAFLFVDIDLYSVGDADTSGVRVFSPSLRTKFLEMNLCVVYRLVEGR